LKQLNYYYIQHQYVLKVNTKSQYLVQILNKKTKTCIYIIVNAVGKRIRVFFQQFFYEIYFEYTLVKFKSLFIEVKQNCMK